MNVLKYIVTGALLCSACNGFLEIKPDKKMSVPHTLEDCELLLNDYSTLNTTYPSMGIIAGEDYYLTSANWNSISVLDDRNAYIWSDEPAMLATPWQGAYRVVYLTNQILSVLEQLPSSQKVGARYSNAYGHALFLRAFAFQQLVEVYGLPYRPNTSDIDLGIPIRLSPDLDVVSKRATLKDTYVQIVSDYSRAKNLLAAERTIKGGTSKSAAYAALARTYLTMKDYEKALNYADSAWRLQAELLDYNGLKASDSYPLKRFNKEVLFSALSTHSNAFGRLYVRMNPGLIASYRVGDLRKDIYFQPYALEPSVYSFKGSYDQGATLFVGLTTSEVLLIRAEAAARIGKIDKALTDINLLRANRWKDNIYPVLAEQNPDRLLDTILEERAKELVFRGRRWSDVKRLSDDPLRAVELKRTIDGKDYTVPVGSPKYALMIPHIVTQQNPSVEQNKR
ncbi:RagB/SusD family nutrient uptake outer membrane protein [Sphingobacterium yanglingense]|uniref:SusD-like starch-binding protein associating with outer membrane n=1 Tax=Sphingobacterium yanglingense TaxID=1437280 RepID=A0A4R6WHT7_9SPHI|nr:RagB/SusD family nutrient uptake outer membrane protein [Sphingobacterium yanglingense]TDQ77967.1 SusD-like starch-binding protein associating with outer membrane [Sphingobacterium yanglingense]